MAGRGFVRDYSKVSGKFWVGRTGRSLRGNVEAQVVALYLMTGPHTNMIGLYRLPIAYIVNDTGIPFEGTSKALAMLHQDGFATYDETAEYVFVRAGARTQIGDTLKPGDKRLANVMTLLEEANDASAVNLIAEFYGEYEEAFGLTPRAFEAPSKPLRSQRTENREQRAESREKEPSSPMLGDIAPRARERHVSSAAADLAAYLAEAILSHKPNAKLPDPVATALEFDVGLRGGTSAERFRAAIDYAHRDPAGSFWRPNVLSAKKLRQKLDTLEIQMAERGSRKQGSKGWAAPAEPSAFAGGEVKL